MPRPVIDWSSVRILHEAHLRLERDYLEELVSWSLDAEGRYGVSAMREGDLTLSDRGDELVLNRCRAVLPGGRPVEISGGGEAAPSIRRSLAADLPVGVRCPIVLYAAPRRPVRAAPSQSRALMECDFLQWNYLLVVEPVSGRTDGLPIGRLVRGASRLELDPEFIPTCLRLNSHPALIEKVERIQSAARRGLNALRGRSAASQPGLAAALATLAPAACLTDWAARPADYLERLCCVLLTQAELLGAGLPVGPEARRAEALACAREALAYPASRTPEEFEWWKAFDLVERALIALQGLYGGTAESAAPSAPGRPERNGNYDMLRIKQL